MMVSCEALDGSDPRKIIDKAKATTAVSNSLRQGVPVAIEMADADGRPEPSKGNRRS